MDMDLKRRMGQPEFTLAPNGTMLFVGRICVPNDAELTRLILEEAYKSSFSIHLGRPRCTMILNRLLVARYS